MKKSLSSSSSNSLSCFTAFQQVHAGSSSSYTLTLVMNMWMEKWEGLKMSDFSFAVCEMCECEVACMLLFSVYCMCYCVVRIREVWSRKMEACV